ncbi:CMRF35-like molecule 1 [Labrus mixtus]|uniref:CMRF35-like molecule 1 n=1 Tax=Labrus mixtus TaxID=508554 RepID=UPI0029BFCDE0|nr:CMRF35-like molecule 1 [Labrus mixtus]XP_060920855.1 CMRF35-like molecule 1 [Labrus mixtus]XP_060920862.1 CMRF35-like molecule 1 [Labrus mixtus]
MKRSTVKDRIELFNKGDVLLVTFTDLQKSDAGKYYCGVERFGKDAYIEVNVKVMDAEPSSPIKTPITVTVTVTTTSPVTSPHVSDGFTDMSTTNQTFNTTTLPASDTQGAGNVLHLMIAVISISTLLMVILLLIRKMKNKKRNVVSSAHVPQEDVQEDVESDDIRLEDQQPVSRHERSSTLYSSADPDSIYMNSSNHQDIESAAQGDNDVPLNQASFSGVHSRAAFNRAVTDQQLNNLYSVVQKPEHSINPIRKPNQSGSNDDDSFYSLAQLTT